MIKPVTAIRALFPALERTHNGHPVAYFDGPGGTQVPRVVAESMTQYLFHHNANTHWEYPTSHETDNALKEARNVVATFLNTGPETIVFGNNMTTLTFHLARSLGRHWESGDEIIVTELDHHANIDPWRDLATERDLTVRMMRMHPETGTLDWKHAKNLVTSRTRLIAIGAASNALGTINDIGCATALARSVGALSFVDAVHYASHVLPDVQALKCDFLACSPYKFYGPHAGVLYGKQHILNNLRVPRLQPAPNDTSERLETGTQNHEGIVGTSAAIHFLGSLASGSDLRTRLETSFFHLHERALAQWTHLWENLSAMESVTCYGPPPGNERTPTLAFTVRGYTSKEVCQQLAQKGLFLSHGDFYASTVVERLGVEGLVRAGVACYTSDNDVTRLIAEVQKMTPRG